MRRTYFYLSILLISASVGARAADDLPKRLDFDRYKGMLEHSPFAVATAVVAPAATPVGPVPTPQVRGVIPRNPQPQQTPPGGPATAQIQKRQPDRPDDE